LSVSGAGSACHGFLYAISLNNHIECIDSDIQDMITGPQMRAARALLDIDQRELAQRSGLSLPTIQRMESSGGVVRGNVDSLMKLVDALAAAGIELIGEGAASHDGGRGVRLKR
jgi:DNA-binding XRE family transcriptional regulator